MLNRLPQTRLSRRQWMTLAAAGWTGLASSGWFETLADDLAQDRRRRCSCILLWMSGGPSQLDTFDLKPGHASGGPFKEIATTVPGLRFSEHLPQLADRAQHLAVIRSMTSKEGDHALATQFIHTGYAPRGPIRYPTFGALVAKELGQDSADLPNFVSIAPFRALSAAAHSAGFLGSAFAPLVVEPRSNDAGPSGREMLAVDDLEQPRGMPSQVQQRRTDLLAALDERFVGEHPNGLAASHRLAYARAERLMRSSAAQAFRLDQEPAELRKAYGRNPFGQGCLLARRLVERGVPFVEVALRNSPNNPVGWDTHTDNFETVKKLSGLLDPAWSTLITDLRERNLLESTVVVWLGEFGRTPKINAQAGRDHFPQVWSAVLAGGPIAVGQAFGRSSEDGMSIVDRPVTPPNLLATLCRALGIDPSRQNDSNIGRPIRIVDPNSEPIAELLA
jgi:hypothetical protein